MNFSNFFPWIAQVIFFVGLLPQIKLNYELKSTKGLSDLLLIGYFNAYVFYLYYIFCLNLPLAHKIMIPLSMIALIVILFQRFYYSQNNDFRLKLFFISNFLLTLSFIPVAIENSYLVGHIAGWLMMFTWAVYQIPQIVKNYKLKSVEGLSFGWIGILFIGDFTEFIVALCLGLPPQTYWNNFRGIVVFLIFCYQFLKYKKSVTK